MCDGSTVCVEADVYTAADRHDTSDLWDDVMDPLEPRQRQLQRNDRSGRMYQLNGYDPSDDDDDDDTTLEGSDLDIEEQQSAVIATTVKTEESTQRGINPRLRRRLEMASVLMISVRHRCDTSTRFSTQVKAAIVTECSWHFELHGNLKQDDMEAQIM